MAWQTIYSSTISALSQQTATLARLQEQTATGSRVNRASDDPCGAAQIIRLTSQQHSLTTYSKNIDTITTDMDQTSTSLQQVSDALTQVKQLLTQASSQTYGSSDLTTVGAELDSLLEEVVSAANTQSLGHYVFGGSATTAAPYAVKREGGKIVSVTYQGANEGLDVAVAQGITQSGVLAGDQVFSGNSRGTPEFLGNTGAQAGSGTSSARGDVWLSVFHDTTTYAGATGVAAGSGSADGDTIAGNGHKLSINADNGTVQLDDGPAVAYTQATTNLKVTDAAGEVAYIDTSNLDPSLTGTTEVAIGSTIKLSTDDGLTKTSVSFGDNQAVTDSRTGQVLYVDTTNVTQTGTEPVSVPGTYDLFDMLINARDLLSGNRPMTDSNRAQLLGKCVDSLDEVMQGVTAQMANVGARQQVIDKLKSSLQDMQDNSTTQVSNLQDADITELSVELAKTQSLYQMTLTSAAKIMSLSLLDYISSSSS